jgi:hypothetical protein
MSDLGHEVIVAHARNVGLIGESRKNGGKNGKKRAVIATARKLAVLLHRLWVSGEVYEPLRNSSGLPLPAAAQFGFINRKHKAQAPSSGDSVNRLAGWKGGDVAARLGTTT